MKNIFLILLLNFSLFATDLVLKDGYIIAHTEMMMDSEINPRNNNLKADISLEGNDFTTISGKFWVEMGLFTSDKSDRDENMYEEIEATKFKLATYTISGVTKTQIKDGYIINGKLNFHGQEKPLVAKAEITVVDGSLVINATSMILFSDFGIEMPCMVFMCVRDQVDLTIKASF